MKIKKFLVVCLSVTFLCSVFSNYTNAESCSYQMKLAGGTWIQDSTSGKWWYKHSDGSYTTNNWEYINGHWYWFDENGWMQTGWKQISGTWYWFGSDDSGYMRVGWERIGGKYYWFNENGAMVTGNRRISGIDYYFNNSGVLTYDASLVAAIYTKDYGDISTLPDGQKISNIISGKYKVEDYSNFTKSSFTSLNNLVKTNNLNRGIFFFSGHGREGGKGISIGNGTVISPRELSNLSMNNTKVAFFFACHCGMTDMSCGESMASAALKAGAKASYAYKVESNTRGDRSVSGFIFSQMMKGTTLRDAVSAAKKIHSTYEPLFDKNLVLIGQTDVIINDTYVIKAPRQLQIPNDYVYRGDESSLELYVREYNGYETTDKFLYDRNNQEYIYERNVLDVDRLSEIDFSVVESNIANFHTLPNNEKYNHHYDYVTMVKNIPTVVRVCSYIENDILMYDCYDLQNMQIINNQVDLFQDIM